MAELAAITLVALRQTSPQIILEYTATLEVPTQVPDILAADVCLLTTPTEPQIAPREDPRLSPRTPLHFHPPISPHKVQPMGLTYLLPTAQLHITTRISHLSAPPHTTLPLMPNNP